MKNLIKSIITSIVLFSAIVTHAETTNSSSSIVGNTNVQNAIVSILMGVKGVGGEVYDASKSAIAAGIDMVKTQAPELVQEFVKWKFTEALIYIIGSSLILVAAGVFFFNAYKYRHDIEVYAPCSMIGCLIGLVGVLCVTRNLMVVMQIWIAPKVYLIQYVIDNIHR